MLRFLLHKKVRRSVFWSLVCVAVLAGIALSQLYVVASGIWWLPALLASLAVGAWKRTPLAIGLAVIAAMLLGNWQGGQFLTSLSVYDSLRGKTLHIEGVISEDPTYNKHRARQFVLSDVVAVSGQQRIKLPGNVYVSTPTSPDVQRHFRVVAHGKLGDAFGPYQASMSFATVRVMANEQHLVDELRQKFAAATASVLPEPHASLGLGFAIGMKSALTEEMSEALKALSLTHVVVASGYNLTVLVRAAKRLREKHSKLQTLLLSVSLIGVFLLITGNSPSMVRAGLVSGLALLAWDFGHRFKPLVLLLLVMAGTALAYPPFLWSDVGWWLSFSAFAGIMILSPLIIERIYKTRQPPLLVQIAIDTAVAEIMTLPIILLIFGNLSLLGIVANVLVGPLIPFAMLATAIAGVVEMTMPALSSLAAVPAHVILALIVAIIRLLSDIPWVLAQVSITPVALVVWYAGFGILATILWRRLNQKRKQAVLRQQIV